MERKQIRIKYWLLLVVMAYSGISILLMEELQFDVRVMPFPQYELEEDPYIIKTENITLENGEVFPYRVFPQMKGFNDVKVAALGICAAERPGRDHVQTLQRNLIFTIVTNFMLYRQEANKHLFVGNGLNVTDKMPRARTMEIIDVFAKNLQHPQVREIHVLVEDERTSDY